MLEVDVDVRELASDHSLQVADDAVDVGLGGGAAPVGCLGRKLDGDDVAHGLESCARWPVAPLGVVLAPPGAKSKGSVPDGLAAFLKLPGTGVADAAGEILLQVTNGPARRVFT